MWVYFHSSCELLYFNIADSEFLSRGGKNYFQLFSDSSTEGTMVRSLVPSSKRTLEVQLNTLPVYVGPSCAKPAALYPGKVLGENTYGGQRGLESRKVFLQLPGSDFQPIILPLQPFCAYEAFTDVCTQGFLNHSVLLKLVDCFLKTSG